MERQTEERDALVGISRVGTKSTRPGWVRFMYHPFLAVYVNVFFSHTKKLPAVHGPSVQLSAVIRIEMNWALLMV